MAIKVRLTGIVSDAPRSLTYTLSGTPRFSFCVRVGGLRKRTYRITAYGTQARFGDRHLHMGDHVQIDGAYLRRAPAVEALVRADTIRHVGRPTPPQHVQLPAAFVPPRPSFVAALNRSQSHEANGQEYAHASASPVADALAAG